jgi:hypothetical protein
MTKNQTLREKVGQFLRIEMHSFSGIVPPRDLSSRFDFWVNVSCD